MANSERQRSLEIAPEHSVLAPCLFSSSPRAKKRSVPDKRRLADGDAVEH